MDKLAGFTLLELLVAISIFSVIGLGSHQMLRTVIDSHDAVKSTTQSYASMNLALAIMQRDFNQFVPRGVRDEYGEPTNPIAFESEDYVVEFTRTGWGNPAGIHRSRLQRVAYSVDYETEELYRHFWKVLDRAEDSEPLSELLLIGVTDFRVTGVIEEDDEFDAGLSDEDFGGPSMAPLAVEVVVATEDLGDIVRIFQLVDPFTAVRSTSRGGPSDSEAGGAQQDDGTEDRSTESSGSTGERDER